MRRAALLAIAVFLTALAAPTALASQPPPGANAGRPAFTTLPEDSARAPVPLSAAGRWIVLLKDGTRVATATERAARIGVKSDHVFSHAARGYSARMTNAQAASLRTDPSVVAVVPDEIISMTGQSIPRGVRRVGGTGSLVARINGTDERVDADVAIVDTGIDKHHEDLNVQGGISCATDDPAAWGDPNGHGTHVAGTVGALDNGIGVVGVAPGVRLWAVRILNSDGNGLLSWYVCGLDWITAQRDPVDPARPLFEAVNMSVAKRGADDGACGQANGDIVHQAICRLVASGVTVVAAAGNNSFNAAKLIPASYDEVITVSALADMDGRPGGLGGNLCYSWGGWDRDDTFADFSNYGRDVDLIAPGKCTWSTLPGNRYGWLSGTSMAAPHVTGAVALYKASRPSATPLEVKAALIAAGNLDWATSTDPDPYHEPMLDVSHIVAAGDFTVDATPGVFRERLLAAGKTVDLPVQLIRAEDFPDQVELSAAPGTPLQATLATPTLAGSGQTSTTMSVTAPIGTPSGRYSIAVTASDGARKRTSTVTVVVDGDLPVAAPASVGAITGTRLDGGSFRARATWPAATDATSAIAGYDVQWRVDGQDWGSALHLAATTRQVSRTMATGHAYVLRVRARDAAGNVGAWAESAASAPRITQDTSRLLARKGTWSISRSSQWSGGTTRYSRVTGAWIRLAFTGRAVALVAPRSASRGRAQVWIDGVKVTTVNLWYGTLLPRRIVFARSWRSAGSHTIRVIVSGTAGHPRVDVDAFIVIP